MLVVNEVIVSLWGRQMLLLFFLKDVPVETISQIALSEGTLCSCLRRLGQRHPYLEIFRHLYFLAFIVSLTHFFLRINNGEETWRPALGLRDRPPSAPIAYLSI